MKGITPIISIIILLLITVALAGAAWAYLSGMLGVYTQKVIEIPPGSAYFDGKTVNIMIRNIGTATINTSSCSVSGDVARCGDITITREGAAGNIDIRPDAVSISQNDAITIKDWNCQAGDERYTISSPSSTYQVEVNAGTDCNSCQSNNGYLCKPGFETCSGTKISYSGSGTCCNIACQADTSVVGLWHFDESSGNTASDSAGGRTGKLINFTHDGIFNNTPYWIPGKSGSALNFNGTSYVRINETVQLNESGTVSFWLNLTMLGAPFSSIISKSTGGGTNQFVYDIGTASGSVYGNLTFSFSNATGQYNSVCVSKYNLTTGSWHYITVTWNTTGCSMYFDGILNSNRLFPIYINTTVAYPTIIGSGYAATPAYHINGSIDEVTIYNRVLSEDEIAQNYQRGVSGNPVSVTNGLIGYWNMDENTGRVVHDSHSQWVAGKVGNALWFDGADDVVNVLSLNSVIQPFTMSAWIRTMPKKYGDNMEIISKRSYPATAMTDFPFGFSVDKTGNTSSISISGGTSYNWDSSIQSDAFSPGQWHLITATYNTTALMLYVDGVLNKSVYNTIASLSSNTRTYTIGMESFETNTGIGKTGFSGVIDEVAIWNRALNATEIAGIYNMQK